MERGTIIYQASPSPGGPCSPTALFEDDKAAELASVLRAIEKVAALSPVRSSPQMSVALPAMQLRNAVELVAEGSSIVPLAGEIEEALDILHDEAARNDPLAHNCLADLYMRGAYVPCDLSLSLYWLQRAARLHDRKALLQLARMHIQGTHYGVQVNVGQAMAYYNRAALDGCTESQYALALLYYKGGPGGLPRPCLGAAVRWLEKAALGGLPQAQYMLGALYRKKPMLNLRIARHWLHQAALGGDVDGCRAYGEMLVRGLGGPRDVAAGRRWIEKTAGQTRNKDQETDAHSHHSPPFGAQNKRETLDEEPSKDGSFGGTSGGQLSGQSSAESTEAELLDLLTKCVAAPQGRSTAFSVQAIRQSSSES